MFVYDPAFADCSGARGGDILGSQGVEEVGPDLAHDAGQYARADHDNGKDEIMDSVAKLIEGRHEVVHGALGAADGKPTGGIGEHEGEQGKEHFRNGEADESDEAAEAVGERVFL